MTGQEASDLIDAAIGRALVSNEDHRDNDILVDWVVVAYVANPNEEEESGYPMFYSNGQMPDYRARGLLTTGLLYLGSE